MSNIEATEKSSLGSRQINGAASEALREVQTERMKGSGMTLERNGTQNLPAYLDMGSPYNKGQENHVVPAKKGEIQDRKPVTDAGNHVVPAKKGEIQDKKPATGVENHVEPDKKGEPRDLKVAPGADNHAQSPKMNEFPEAKTTKELSHDKGVPVNKGELPAFSNLFQKL